MGQPEAQENSKVELKAKATGGDELPWMPPPPPPARSTKIIRKMKENPFVPLGKVTLKTIYSVIATSRFCVSAKKRELNQ